MKKLWTKYCGVILLYSVVFLGIIAINTSTKYLNEQNLERSDSTIAVGDK